MFSKTYNFLFNITLYLEIKFTDPPDRRAPHLSDFDHPFASLRGSFILELVRKSGLIITYIVAYRTAYFSYFILLSSSLLLYSFLLTLPYSLLPFYWDIINLNSLPPFSGRKCTKTTPNYVLTKVQSHLIENTLRQFQIVS